MVPAVFADFESVSHLFPGNGPHHRIPHERFHWYIKKCWAFLGFLPDIGKLVIASVLLHVFFKMTHRRVLTLTIGKAHPTLNYETYFFMNSLLSTLYFSNS